MAILKNKQANITLKLPYAQQQLGVDLKISSNGDLEINNLSDISLVAGLYNVAQAIGGLLSTEAGENRYHPSLGINAPIGEKTVSAFALRQDILNTLRQDPRLDDIQVKVENYNNVYLVTITLTVLGQQLSVPLQFVSES